jgi:Transposase
MFILLGNFHRLKTSWLKLKLNILKNLSIGISHMVSCPRQARTLFCKFGHFRPASYFCNSFFQSIIGFCPARVLFRPHFWLHCLVALGCEDTTSVIAVVLSRSAFILTSGLLEPMRKAADMVERHLEGILAHWQQGLTTAFMEGLNSLFSATKRKARGYRSVEYQTAMLYFVAGKLEIPYYA